MIQNMLCRTRSTIPMIDRQRNSLSTGPAFGRQRIHHVTFLLHPFGGQTHLKQDQSATCRQDKQLAALQALCMRLPLPKLHTLRNLHGRIIPLLVRHTGPSKLGHPRRLTPFRRGLDALQPLRASQSHCTGRQAGQICLPHRVALHSGLFATEPPSPLTPRGELHVSSKPKRHSV